MAQSATKPSVNGVNSGAPVTIVLAEGVRETGPCIVQEAEFIRRLAAREHLIPIDRVIIRRDEPGKRGYQRDEVRKTVNGICGDFDYDRFDRVWLVPLGNGYYECFDGGNRITALHKLHYTGGVPSNVVSVKAAKAFLLYNGNRTPISAFRRYIASLESKEQWARDVRDVLKEVELELVGGGTTARHNHIACSYELECVWNVGGKLLLDKVVRTAAGLIPGDSNMFQQDYLRAVRSAIGEIEALEMPVEQLIAGFRRLKVTWEGFHLKEIKMAAQAAVKPAAARLSALRFYYNQGGAHKWGE